MSTQEKHALSSLKQDRGSFVLVLLAMLLQVFFSAVHFSASAATLSPNIEPGQKFGLFEICSGQGTVYVNINGESIEPANGTSDTRLFEICDICLSFSTEELGEDAPVEASYSLSEISSAGVVFEKAHDQARTSDFKRSGTLRGPPASLCSI